MIVHLTVLQCCYIVFACSCFHKNPVVFFGAFLGPILAVLLFNLVIFLWVIVILVRHTRGQAKRSSEKMKPKTVVRLLISISSIMFLFGLSWIFAAFTFQIDNSNTLRYAFQVLFTIFASFQGFFIFFFFCVINQEARESWKEFLSCGHYKSKFLHPSQYKTTNSAGAGSNTLKANTNTTRVFSSTDSNSATLEKVPYKAQLSSAYDKKDSSTSHNTLRDLSKKNNTIGFTLDAEGVSTFPFKDVFDQPDSRNNGMRYSDFTSVNGSLTVHSSFTVTSPTLVIESSTAAENGKPTNCYNTEPINHQDNN